MTSRFDPDDPPSPRVAVLSPNQCIDLLGSGGVGRIAWQTDDGPQILPVNFVFLEGLAYFRTSPHGLLSELVQPCAVALEVDDLDHRYRTGWSVVLHGQAQSVAAPQQVMRLWAADQISPWAPGDKSLVIQVTPAKITGRTVSRV